MRKQVLYLVILKNDNWKQCIHNVEIFQLLADVVGSEYTVLDPRSGDMKEYLVTTERLIALQPLLLLPAHGNPVYNPIARLHTYLQHRLEREEQILSVLQSGHMILKTMYYIVPKRIWKYAKYNIQLHLKKLLKEHKIVQSNSQYLLK